VALIDDLATSQEELWAARVQAEAEFDAANDDLNSRRRARADTGVAAGRVAAAELALATSRADDAKYRRLLMMSMLLQQFPAAEDAIAAEFRQLTL
jgi:hypothetical protein